MPTQPPSSSSRDIVTDAAEQAACEALAESHIIRLSAEGQRAFIDLLLNPPPPAEALLRAMSCHEQLIWPV